MAAYQILFLDRIPAYAAVSEAVEACKGIGGRGVAGFANALLRQLARTGEPPLPDARGRSGRLPGGGGRISRLAGAACCSPSCRPPRRSRSARRRWPRRRSRCGRTRRASRATRCWRASPPSVRAPRSLPSAIAPDAILARRFDAPATTAAWREGLFAVQDAGAQVVAELCGAAPGERILDACAGGGGKTAHLLALSGGQAAGRRRRQRARQAGRGRPDAAAPRARPRRGSWPAI